MSAHAHALISLRDAWARESGRRTLFDDVVIQRVQQPVQPLQSVLHEVRRRGPQQAVRLKLTLHRGQAAGVRAFPLQQRLARVNQLTFVADVVQLGLQRLDSRMVLRRPPADRSEFPSGTTANTHLVCTCGAAARSVSPTKDLTSCDRAAIEKIQSAACLRRLACRPTAAHCVMSTAALLGTQRTVPRFSLCLLRVAPVPAARWVVGGRAPQTPPTGASYRRPIAHIDAR